jgi:type VI secretion system Hcp family effector
MALDAFLEISGVKGSARQKTREGQMVVFAVDHAIGSTRDSSGFPDKAKIARHLVVTKEIDAASPKLQEMAFNGTKIPTAVLRLWRMPPGGGTEENFYTIALGDAKIDSVRTVMLFNRLESQSLLPQYEQVVIAYKNAKFKYSAGGKEGGTDKAVATESDMLIYDILEPLNDAAGEAIKDAVKGAFSDAFDATKGAIGGVITQAIKEAWDAGAPKPPGGGG